MSDTDQNTTKILVDTYGLREETIAHRTGAHFNSVRAWYTGVEPLFYYRRKLERLLAEQRKKTK